MGLKVTAAEAGWLVDRHERIVRGHIKRGDLPAEKVGKSWQIDVDDLELIPGWKVNRERLAQMEEQARVRLEANTVSGMAAQIQQMAQTLQTLQHRVLILEQELGRMKGEE